MRLGALAAEPSHLSLGHYSVEESLAMHLFSFVDHEHSVVLLHFLVFSLLQRGIANYARLILIGVFIIVVNSFGN